MNFYEDVYNIITFSPTKNSYLKKFIFNSCLFKKICKREFYNVLNKTAKNNFKF